MQVLTEHGRPLRDAQLFDGEDPVARTNGKGWMRIPPEARVCHPVLTGENRAHIDLSGPGKLKPDAQGDQVFTLPEARVVAVSGTVDGRPCTELTVARAGKGGPVLAFDESGAVKVELLLGKVALKVSCGPKAEAGSKEIPLLVTRELQQTLEVDFSAPPGKAR
jgi:hypothetical protein